MTDEEVWLRAYLARIGTHYGALPSCAREAADDCLAEFRGKFRLGDSREAGADGKTFDASAAEVTRKVGELQDKAVTAWAAQCGKTPEEWLQYYRSRITLEPSEDIYSHEIRVSVSAEPRDRE